MVSRAVGGSHLARVSTQWPIFFSIFSQGGAFLVGPVDEETGQFCGKNILYLYPDLKTAISGRFIGKVENHTVLLL